MWLMHREEVDIADIDQKEKMSKIFIHCDLGILRHWEILHLQEWEISMWRGNSISLSEFKVLKNVWVEKWKLGSAHWNRYVLSLAQFQHAITLSAILNEACPEGGYQKMLCILYVNGIWWTDASWGSPVHTAWNTTRHFHYKL